MASGILIALFGFIVPSQIRFSKGAKIGFFLFAIFYGLGTVVTGYFPCDIGCNPDPEQATLSQFIHNASGFLTYCIVPFCLILIGVSVRKIEIVKRLSKVSIICGALSLIFVVLLFGNPTGSFIGLFQRIIEGSILFWIIFTAFFIQRTKIK